MLDAVLEAAIDVTAADMGNLQRSDEDGMLRIEAQRGFESGFLDFFGRVDAHTDSACGTAVATLVPYAERALRFAADIVDRNPHFDAYFASKDFVAQFGERLYADISSLGIDTSDYVPITLQQLAQGGKTYALPLFADQEMFIYNSDYWKSP